MSHKCLFCSNYIEHGKICKKCISKRKKECTEIQDKITILCPKCLKVIGYDYNKRGVRLRLNKILCEECQKEKMIEFQRKNICPYCGKEEFLTDYYSNKGHGVGSKLHKPSHKPCSECYRGVRKWNAKSIEAKHLKFKKIKEERLKQKKLEREKRLIMYKERSNYNKQQKLREEKIKNGTFNFDISERMKKNNPMKNPETVRKNAETRKRNLLLGKTKIKTGKDRYNYNGGRPLHDTARRKLYKPWVFKVLERDSFKCAKCGSTRNLQVHHIKPFNEIVKMVLARHNIEYRRNIYEKDIGNFDQIVQEIVNEHKLEHGITLCKFCHEEVDYRYRIYKGVKKCK